MNGAYGQQGGGYGQPGAGQPMGDSQTGGLTVSVPLSGPGGQGQAMGAPAALVPVQAYPVPQAGGQGGQGGPPRHPLVAWIPSFPTLINKADHFARQLPWYLWVLGTILVLTVLRSESGASGWMAKVKKLVLGIGGKKSSKRSHSDD